LQDNATAENLAHVLVDYLSKPALRLAVSGRLAGLRTSLQQGADEVAASTVMRLARLARL
jgi:hypothetical protein